jgi:hypothetical protein
MDLQRVNRSDAEKVYIHYRNMSGATINANAAVCLDLGTTIDGISSIAPASGSFLGWIGISNADVADTGYDRAQAFGYRDRILVSHEGTSVTVTAGEALHLVNGQFGLSTSTVEALSTCGWKYVINASTQDASAAVYTDGIIRCL